MPVSYVEEVLYADVLYRGSVAFLYLMKGDYCIPAYCVEGLFISVSNVEGVLYTCILCIGSILYLFIV